MFTNKMSDKDRALIEEAAQEMRRISLRKPLGYLERGWNGERVVSPSAITHVPQTLLTYLLKKEDVYILSKHPQKDLPERRASQERKDTLDTKDTQRGKTPQGRPDSSTQDEIPPSQSTKDNLEIKDKTGEVKNPENRILLLEPDDSTAGNRIFVFHMAALKDLLDRNRALVRAMFAEEDKTGDTLKQPDLSEVKHKPSKSLALKPIENEDVIAFVKLVSIKDYSSFQPISLDKSRSQSEVNERSMRELYQRAKPLIDAAFADTNLFFTNKHWGDIHLTDALNEVFKPTKQTIEKFPLKCLEAFGPADWQHIKDEYKKQRSWLGSTASKILAEEAIATLANHSLLANARSVALKQVFDFVNRKPIGRLSTIIRSTNPMMTTRPLTEATPFATPTPSRPKQGK